MKKGKRFHLKIMTKIVLLASGLTLFTATTLGSLAYLRTTEVAVDTAINGLAGEARLVAQRVDGTIDEMANDLFVALHTPPVEGLLRALKSGGTDPVDGSTDQEWRDRLARIFSSIMANRPHYTQMRYLGIWDNGKEIVRVDRTGDMIRRVPAIDLQEKAEEEYFRESLGLRQGDAYLSRVTLNRERGRVASNRVPTIRLVVPVFHLGQLTGMLVINADYTALLQRAFLEGSRDKDAYVINAQGDTHLFDHETGEVSLLYNSGKEGLAAVREAEPVAGHPNETILRRGDMITYYVETEFPAAGPHAAIATGLAAQRSELLAGARRAQRSTLELAALLLGACFLASFAAARALAGPMKRLQTLIDNASSLEDVSKLSMDGDDEIASLTRSFKDLSRRLRSSEVQAKEVMENIIEGIVTINESGIIQDANAALGRLFGYSEECLIGRNVSGLLTPEVADRHDEMIRQALKTGSSNIIGGIGREVRGRKADGTEVDIALSVSEVRDGSDRLFVGVVRDITEQKRVERMKNEFISTVSHELRTPLTSIRAALGMLRLHAEFNLDTKSRRLLELSLDNTVRLTALVDDILDTEKIAAGKMQYRIETVDVCELVSTVVTSNQSFADSYGVAMRVEMSGAPILCRVDRNRFSQAVINLLSNAVKFSPTGETVMITVDPRRQDGVRISVWDRGPGIPQHFHASIYEKFAQADSSSTRSKNGTGLGLSITKSLVEAFDGQISFETTEGSGTTFHIDLPRLEVDKVA